MQELMAYGCDHCGMTSRHRSSVLRHEKSTCKKNPNRKACITCVHFFNDGMDDNGMDEPYKETWLMAGCDNDNIIISEDIIFAERNCNRECAEYKVNPSL